MSWWGGNPHSVEPAEVEPAEAATAPKFVNVGASVIRGSESIATCRSVTMAKRIAAALNWYKPGKRGS